MDLTDKQERFAILVAAGKAQCEAYLEAYPASKKYSRNMLDAHASALAAQGKVRVRIDALRKPMLDAAIAEAEAEKQKYAEAAADIVETKARLDKKIAALSAVISEP
jgi:hypothetical protein